MSTHHHLSQTLLNLDRQSYKAYKQLQGTYTFPGFTLIIDHVQGDPFAAPSRVRVQVPQQGAHGAGFPPDLVRSPSRHLALRDYLHRQVYRAASQGRSQRGSGKSGLISIASPVQQVLDRNAVLLDDHQIEVRFVVGLPAQGRSILGRQAAALLCDDIPKLVARSLRYDVLDADQIRQHVETVEDADALRSHLQERGLVAFIADGAILPRRSGIDDRPLDVDSIPFQSPPSLRVELTCPNRGPVTGMGIPRGISLIVGGGYHGKSTLLNAIAKGVYNHIPGDGRERVVTEPTAMKIRAEDGRSIVRVNISPFINHLPQGRSTQHFSSDNASGSTSQAANTIEAVQAGAHTLLVDEDTSATNFMIRDRRMQALIAKDQEPITPFLDKIRQLYQDYGVSTLLVMGGSGDYFDVADTVIAMTQYAPQEVTQQARAIAHEYANQRCPEGGQHFGVLTPRVPLVQGLGGRDDRRIKVTVRDLDEIQIGHETIDLSAVEQLVDPAQLRTIGLAIAALHDTPPRASLATVVQDWIDRLQTQGFDGLTGYPTGDCAMVRPIDFAAALNRLRSLHINEGDRP
ncbi:MAG: ATPase [Leptolyngbya sp. DLM2.Bin15]|nr:MAG: ATPase [Leptolyngbya sp. DLM2.Bin15]